MTSRARLLVSRPDKLGDFMLAWPALALLRRALPDTRITVLVGRVAAEMARVCPSVDSVVVDEGQPLKDLVHRIRIERFDAAIALFSEQRISFATFLARIPYRLGPATKIYQFLFNDRLVQRRSTSSKPEYFYNCDLIVHFLKKTGVAVPKLPQPPYLRVDEKCREDAKARIMATHTVPKGARLVIVHPGSGGSAGNLSLAGYSTLVNCLKSDHPLFILVTAGPGEKKLAESVVRQINVHPCAVYNSEDGLSAFSGVISVSDVFISGSTGPLHIAGALDVPTAAFYPRRKSSTALRWQTTNSSERRLAFSPPWSAPEQDLESIDLNRVAATINRYYLNANCA